MYTLNILGFRGEILKLPQTARFALRPVKALFAPNSPLIVEFRAPKREFGAQIFFNTDYGINPPKGTDLQKGRKVRLELFKIAQICRLIHLFLCLS